MRATKPEYIDRVVTGLLFRFEQARGPGMTIGVVRGDQLSVHRSAGYANIEAGIALGPTTSFRIASVSKQFTCALILMMAAEGLLCVDDDIRDWLPQWPDFGHRITLDHLMHDTSGIRDMLEVMRLGGMDLDQPCGSQDLMEALCRQRNLNFQPGARYLYSNSGFMLLGRVAETAGGAPLETLLERRIFAPLGMAATRHTPSAAEDVAGLAVGYLPLPSGGWQRAKHRFALGGEGGLISSVPDLAQWHRWLCSAAGETVARGLSTVLPFAGGAVGRYGRGVGLGEYRGLALVEHGGLWPGYRAAFIRVRDRRLGLIAMTNDTAVDPQEAAYRLLDADIDELPPTGPIARAEPSGSVARQQKRWVNETFDATIDVTREGTRLVSAFRYGVEMKLRELKDGQWGIAGGTTPIVLRLRSDGLLEMEEDAGIVAVYHAADGAASLPEGLSGVYVNEDTAARWIISGTTMEVTGPLVDMAIFSLEPTEGDLFRVIVPTYRQSAWFDARVRRDHRNNVVALEVNGARVRNLVFTQVEHGRHARLRTANRTGK
jgi:CubicO group peptidase (beta-lactamase class C family)